MSGVGPLVDAAVELLRLDPDGWKQRFDEMGCLCGYTHVRSGLQIGGLRSDGLVFTVHGFHVGFFERRRLRAALFSALNLRYRGALAQALLADSADSTDSE